MEEKFNKYDQVCSHIINILLWNHRQDREFIVSNYDLSKDSHKFIFALLRKLNNSFGYKTYVKLSYLELLKLRHKVNYPITNKLPKQDFIFNIEDFVHEMCVSLSIDESLLGEIYNEYYKEDKK